MNISVPKLQLEIALLDKNNVASALPASTGPAPIPLTAQDHRLTFIATVMHYLNPSKNTYLYRLTGFDKDWINGSATDKKITYPPLAPGRYQFQIPAGQQQRHTWRGGGYADILDADTSMENRMGVSLLYCYFWLFPFIRPCNSGPIPCARKAVSPRNGQKQNA